MKFHHVVETPYRKSFRADNVAGMFDIPPQEKLRKEWEVDMPIEDFEWRIGLIVGPSGAGKTTIAKRAFPEATFFDGKQCFKWSKNKCLLEDFDPKLSSTEITGALSQVGFSSPPAWLLPFDALSNGQKFRTEMARLILEAPDLAVVDEFTSVVDRQVAKVCSFATQKLVRKSQKQMVAVSCHFDIIDWLEPDWIYHVHTGEFQRGSLRRPEIKLSIQRVHHSAWKLFRGHHYLSADCNTSAICFLASIESEPVAFTASLPFQHPVVKNIWREHRTVVLPDYQGLGIGNKLSSTVAQFFVDMGKRYVSTTSHPAMAAFRRKHPELWIETRAPGQVPPKGKNGKMQSSAGRMTASFEYVAPVSIPNMHWSNDNEDAYLRRIYLSNLFENYR